MNKVFSLASLRQMNIAHTDAGDFLFVNGKPQNEFIVKGIIKKIRASLFYVEIEEENYTTHKRQGYKVGDEINCVVKTKIKEGKINFIITGIE